MVTVAKVNLWNTFVGAVAWDEQKGYANFEYDANFIKKGWNISPITMPLDATGNARIYSFPALNPETYKGLPGLLIDSLPDKFGNQLLNIWLANQGRNPNSFNPVEHLCYTGKRGMGALEYEPVSHPFDQTSTSLEIDRLVAIAKHVLDERQQFKTNLDDEPFDGLQEIIKVGTSAGGARAKAVIAYNEKTGDVRSGQIDNLKDYAYWIIKFDGITNKSLGDPMGYGKIEYAYYLMAQAAGIDMMESKLLSENGRHHFITKRFDREGNKKLHMQTLCAISHFDYNMPGAYSYEQAFQTMRQLKLPYTSAVELFRRMCFNVIARNQDDHTKNIGFLMDQTGTWRLSPAYDITYAFDPANKWMKLHQMSINGKRENITEADFLAIAKKMNIKKPKIIIDEVKDAVSNWPKFAKAASMDKKQVDALGKTHKIVS